MREQYKFTIKGPNYREYVFPNLNNYIHACDKNYAIGNKMKRDNQSIACWEIRTQLTDVHIKKPVMIDYHIYEPNRKRDKSNVGAFAVKVIEDALQQCGTILNDNWTYMRGYSIEVDLDKQNPRIEVTITVLEDYET